MALKITIAGAGIGGLAAGIALARNGHSVRIAESAPEISEVGAGLQISPNGRAVLAALGLTGGLDAVAINAQSARLLDGPSGRQVTRLDLSQDEGHMVWSFIHRARLVELLVKAAHAAGVTIDTNTEITPPRGGAALDGDDILIGADGLHSKVRQILNPSVEPFFTRQVAWRALIPDHVFRGCNIL